MQKQAMSTTSSLLSNRSTHIHDRFICTDVTAIVFDAYGYADARRTVFKGNVFLRLPKINKKFLL
jgi:hypothetical protein